MPTFTSLDTTTAVATETFENVIAFGAAAGDLGDKVVEFTVANDTDAPVPVGTVAVPAGEARYFAGTGGRVLAQAATAYVPAGTTGTITLTGIRLV